MGEDVGQVDEGDLPAGGVPHGGAFLSLAGKLHWPDGDVWPFPVALRPSAPCRVRRFRRTGWTGRWPPSRGTTPTATTRAGTATRGRSSSTPRAASCASPPRRRRFVVPPGRALWVPAGLPHAVSMRGGVAMRALFVRPRRRVGRAGGGRGARGVAAAAGADPRRLRRAAGMGPGGAGRPRRGADPGRDRPRPAAAARGAGAARPAPAPPGGRARSRPGAALDPRRLGGGVRRQPAHPDAAVPARDRA